MISLLELGRADEALRFAATELAVAQHLTDLVVGGVGEPELSALVLGKAADASERGVELRVDDDVEIPAGVVDPRGTSDDRRQPARQRRRRRRRSFGPAVGPAGGRRPRRKRGGRAEVRRRRQRPRAGTEAAAHAFDRGWTTKKTDRPMGRGVGLALVAQAVHRLGGTISVVNEVGAVFTRAPARRGAVPPPDAGGVAEPDARTRIAVDIPTPARSP